MWKFLKKYAMLVIVASVLTGLLSEAILLIWPKILMTEYPNGVIQKLGTGYLLQAVGIIINVAFIFLIYKDMKNEKVTSIPVLILTFFSAALGALFFLLILAESKLKFKHIHS